MIFDNIESIQKALANFKSKDIGDYTDSDISDYVLAHKQNGSGVPALAIQLMYELGYSQEFAENLSRYCCKLIATKIQLDYIKAETQTFSQWYNKFYEKKIFSWKNGKYNPGYMALTTKDFISKNYPGFNCMQINNFQEFLDSDKPFYQVRIHVVTAEEEYDHSLMCADMGSGKIIKDVSWRGVDADIKDYVNSRNFLYATWIS